MSKKIETSIRVFSDKGSILISAKDAVFASPSEVVYLMRLALKELEEMYPWTMDDDERKFSEYLLSGENPQKQ